LNDDAGLANDEAGGGGGAGKGTGGVMLGGSGCTTVAPLSLYAAADCIVLKSSSKPVPDIGCAIFGIDGGRVTGLLRGCTAD
jgi:hypothetical protein